MNNRASVFIGSSSEGKIIAEALQLNLDELCDTVIWHQGLFGLSHGTLETLVEELPSFDFAILVLTPDDLLKIREDTLQSARDNVLLEFGLCVGTLGRKRTFAVFERSSKMRIPSDLAGVTLADYQLQKSGNVQASVGPASTKIKNAILRLGLRTKAMNEVPNSSFIAVPMNAFKEAGTPDRYQEFRGSILPVLDVLRRECGMKEVHCAIETIERVEDFDLPGASLDIDFDKVQRNEFFIVIYLNSIISKSVLIEIGMALALGKKCVICAEKGAVLPFILRDAASVAHNVKKFEFSSIGDLEKELRRNKNWLFTSKAASGTTL